MIFLDYSTSERRIYAKGDNAKSQEKLSEALIRKRWAQDLGGVWAFRGIHLSHFSEAMLGVKDKWELSKNFKAFREVYEEEHVEKSEETGSSTVIMFSNPRTTFIKRGKFSSKKMDKAMKFFFKPATRMKSYEDGKWDGYVHLYDVGERTFPTGLLFLAKQILEKEGVGYRITHMYNRRPPRQFDWIVNDGIVPDPDQIEAVEAAYQAGRSILKAPTGFGKTAILAKRLTAKFAVPTLFVANRKSLLDDAKEEFISGIEGLEVDDVGVIMDGRFCLTKVQKDMTREDIGDITSPIIVATIQSLHKKLQDERTRVQLKRWLKKTCKFVMVDETQAVGSTIWDEVFAEINAPYRALLSATPKRTDGATLKIKAAGGDIAFFTTAEEQIEKGRLSEVRIESLVYDHKLYNKDDKDIEYHEAYAEWIVHNEERNLNYVVRPALSLLNEGHYVLVLIQRIEHGEILMDLFEKNGVSRDEIRFIYGETKDSYRKQAIKEFRKGGFRILIGSTIFDVGVNIPIISGMVLAGAGNSEITLVQRIGRSVRNADYEAILGYLPEFMQKSSGKVAKVYDIYDVNVKFFEYQAKNRYNVAKDEFGASRVSVVGKITRPQKEKNRKPKSTDPEIMKKLENMKSTFGSSTPNANPASEAEQSVSKPLSEVMAAFKNRNK